MRNIVVGYFFVYGNRSSFHTVITARKKTITVTVYCNSPGLVMDVLVKENGVIGNLNILTDGEWIWPSDLSYYVELYHVKLNEDFVMHMKKVNWIMLNQQEIKWDQLEL